MNDPEHSIVDAYIKNLSEVSKEDRSSSKKMEYSKAQPKYKDKWNHNVNITMLDGIIVHKYINNNWSSARIICTRSYISSEYGIPRTIHSRSNSNKRYVKKYLKRYFLQKISNNFSIERENFFFNFFFWEIIGKKVPS